MAEVYNPLFLPSTLIVSRAKNGGTSKLGRFLGKKFSAWLRSRAKGNAEEEKKDVDEFDAQRKAREVQELEGLKRDAEAQEKYHQFSLSRASSLGKTDDTEALRQKLSGILLQVAKPAEEKEKDVAPAQDLSDYQLPSPALLKEAQVQYKVRRENELRAQAIDLQTAMEQYKIPGAVVSISSDPSATLFEVRLAPGVRVAQLKRVDIDIARTMRVANIRIVPIIAGKDTVGIEIPTAHIRENDSIYGERDPLFEKAVDIIVMQGCGSASLLQAKMGVGYSRAIRLIEQITDAGILGSHRGSQAREALLSQAEWEKMKSDAAGNAE